MFRRVERALPGRTGLETTTTGLPVFWGTRSGIEGDKTLNVIGIAPYFNLFKVGGESGSTGKEAHIRSLSIFKTKTTCARMLLEGLPVHRMNLTTDFIPTAGGVDINIACCFATKGEFTTLFTTHNFTEEQK